MQIAVRQKAQVIVLECIAVNPVYAQWLEEKVMRSHIGVITNVRYDHPDYQQAKAWLQEYRQKAIALNILTKYQYYFGKPGATIYSVAQQ